MTDNLVSAALILLFVLVGGVFAAAEIALVSLRAGQARMLARRGKRGRTLSRLLSNPNRFLSAVQIGVTVFTFLGSAFGASTLAGPFSKQLQRLAIPAAAADPIALVLLTLVIAYVSIVVGELTAKRLALQRSEAYALALGPMVSFIASFARPAIWLLGISTDGLVRLLGGDPKAGREEITSDEIRAMVSGSEDLGAEERQIIDDVFAAGSHSVREVMVPRTEVDFLDGDLPVNEAVLAVIDAAHSRYPVLGNSADDVLGFVHVRDLLDPGVRNLSVPVRELIRAAISLPETIPVLLALTELRRASAQLAIVVDEYGGTAGIVTLEDLVEDLVGEITDEYDQPDAGRDPDHDREVDGLLPIDDFSERTGLNIPSGRYDTVAEFFVAQLGRIPELDDRIRVDTHRREGADEGTRVQLELQVTELDGRRASRFVATMTPIESTPQRMPT